MSKTIYPQPNWTASNIHRSPHETWNRANPHGGLCFCSCSTTGAWISTSRACQGTSLWPCRHIPVKSGKDKINCCWDTSAAVGIRQGQVAHQPSSSLLRVQHTGEWLKCYQGHLSQPCGQWPWYWARETKATLMHWKSSSETQGSRRSAAAHFFPRAHLM